MKKALVLLLAVVGVGVVIRLHNDFLARSERNIRDKHRQTGDPNYLELTYQG